MDPPNDTKWKEVVSWYKDHFLLDLETLPSWALVDELRLVANALKHAEGAATKQLRELRPELFRNPILNRFGDSRNDADGEIPQFPVHLPLAGEDLFVTDSLLTLYSQAAESFFNEIAQHFDGQDDQYFPR